MLYMFVGIKSLDLFWLVEMNCVFCQSGLMKLEPRACQRLIFFNCKVKDLHSHMCVHRHVHTQTHIYERDGQTDRNLHGKYEKEAQSKMVNVNFQIHKIILK